MVTVKLAQGESVRIEFEKADGAFQVTFGRKKVTVKAELPDTKGRKGVIYEERFGYPDRDMTIAEAAAQAATGLSTVPSGIN